MDEFRRRWYSGLVVLWLVVATVVWNVVFDLHINGGVHEYFRVLAEADLGRGPSPVMADIMAGSRGSGMRAASTLALVVFAAGCMTTFASCNRPRDLR